MWRGALQGSVIAFTICGLSLVFCCLIRLIPPYFFAALLGLWALYATCMLVIVLVMQRGIPASDPEKRADLGYWLGAIVSSFLAALLWLAIVVILTSTIMRLHH